MAVLKVWVTNFETNFIKNRFSCFLLFYLKRCIIWINITTREPSALLVPILDETRSVHVMLRAELHVFTKFIVPTVILSWFTLWNQSSVYDS